HLEYNSLWADPRPIIHFGYANIPPPTSDDRLAAELSLAPSGGGFSASTGTGSGAGGSSGGAGQTGLSPPENYWLLPASGGPVEAALQADLTSQPTGLYNFTLSTGLIRYDHTLGRFVGAMGTGSDPVVSVNAVDSAFGAGWGLAGLQRI